MTQLFRVTINLDHDYLGVVPPHAFKLYLISSAFQGKTDKTMANKLMYILNVNTQSYPFCRLDLLVEM